MQHPLILGEGMTDKLLHEDERLDEVNEKITLIQKKDGLTFGTDAFLLAAFIKEQKYARAVELGAGTGIISLLCAARERLAHITAVEIQEDFFDITSRNIVYNQMSEKISAVMADARVIKASDIGGEVDVVFSNPPYMKTDSGKRNESDRKYIARHEVCGDINDFCAAAYRLLKHGGKFYCVWRPDRLTSLVCALRASRLEPKSMIFVHSDENAEPSMVLICASKGGGEGMKILPPLFMNERNADEKGRRELTPRARKIYDTMSFTE